MSSESNKPLISMAGIRFIRRKNLQSLVDHSVYALLFILSLFLLSSITSCRTEEITLSGCETPAVVRDLRGLDGCGFVLELANGQRLEPMVNQMISCEPTPSGSVMTVKSQVDNVTLTDGLRVLVSYKVREDVGSICMVGPVVELTCLTVQTAD
jgi:hypothetical protein